MGYVCAGAYERWVKPEVWKWRSWEGYVQYVVHSPAKPAPSSPLTVLSLFHLDDETGPATCQKDGETRTGIMPHRGQA